MSLPQKQSLDEQRDRRAAVERSRPEWAWTWPEGLPPHIKSTPSSEKPIGQQVEWMSKIGTRFTTEVVELKLKAAHERVKKFFGEGNDPLAPYSTLFDADELPAIAKIWETDDFFGSQRLNGLQPEYLFRVTELPASFKNTTMPKLALPEGKTLESLMADGLIYAIDHPELEGAPGLDSHDVIHSPTVLFFSDAANKKLVPLAAKLDAKSTHVFTPQDGTPNLWLAVKIAVNRAAFALHMPRDHFLCFHFLMEVIYVSLQRNVSPQHPLFKLLAPHFKFHLYADDTARSKGASVPTNQFIAKKFYQKMQAGDGGLYRYFNLPADLKARGVDDAAKLPDYLYRDEGLVLWAAYHKFAMDFVGAVYTSAADFAGDYELHRWIREITDPLFGGFTGLPLKADSPIDAGALAELITSILYTVTSHHSFSTTAGADYYAFVPNQPSSFNFVTPKDKSEIKREDIANMLPPLAEAVQQMAEIHSIEVYSFAPLMRLWESDFLSGVPNGAQLSSSLAAALTTIEKDMTERSKTRADPFLYFLPSKTACSVWN